MRNSIHQDSITGKITAASEEPRRARNGHWHAWVVMGHKRYEVFKCPPTQFAKIRDLVDNNVATGHYEIVEKASDNSIWRNMVSIKCADEVIWRYPGDDATVESVG